MLLAGHLLAQPPDEKIEAALNSVPSQAVVVVRKHQMGADMVEITMLDPKYPLDLLRDQVRKVGEYAGSTSRGIQVGKTAAEKESQQFVKAAFATDNLIDEASGRLRLEPFARAFAGAPKPHTVQAFLVSFEGQRPTEKTLKTFQSETIALSGRAIPPPFGGLEYRVALFSQDPAKIAIPDEHQPAPPPPAKAEPAPRESGNGLKIALLVIAALAAGALVYFFMSRPGRRPTDSPSRRTP